jgi:hypothetical protein
VVLPKGCLNKEIRFEGLECQRVGGFYSGSSPNAGAPEWKEFIKIVWFGGELLDDGTDIQFVVIFGMFFGPGKPN